MTDTTIESVPAGEVLTPREQRALKRTLTDRLRGQNRRAAEWAAALDDVGTADAPEERERARDALDSALVAARQLEHALQRLDAGTYGICATCGGSIPVERLHAIPEVDRCVGCLRTT